MCVDFFLQVKFATSLLALLAGGISYKLEIFYCPNISYQVERSESIVSPEGWIGSLLEQKFDCITVTIKDGLKIK